MSFLTKKIKAVSLCHRTFCEQLTENKSPGPFDILGDVIDTRLRTLELACPITFPNEDQPEVFDDSFQSMFIFDLAARILKPFSNLTTLIFNFRVPYSTRCLSFYYSAYTLRLRKHCPDHDTPCTALDKLFSGPSFPALIVLAFRLDHIFVPFFGWKEYIESTFPLCRQKGLLQTGVYEY